MTVSIYALILALMVTPTKQHKKEARALADIIIREAAAHHLQPELVVGVINRESGFDRRAVGGVGEIGYMQINPNGEGTFMCKGLMHKLYNAEANIRCGIRLLARAMQRCGCSPEIFISRYQGNGCVSTTYSRSILMSVDVAINSCIYSKSIRNAS